MYSALRLIGLTVATCVLWLSGIVLAGMTIVLTFTHAPLPWWQLGLGWRAFPTLIYAGKLVFDRAHTAIINAVGLSQHYQPGDSDFTARISVEDFEHLRRGTRIYFCSEYGDSGDYDPETDNFRFTLFLCLKDRVLYLPHVYQLGGLYDGQINNRFLVHKDNISTATEFACCSAEPVIGDAPQIVIAALGQILHGDPTWFIDIGI